MTEAIAKTVDIVVPRGRHLRWQLLLLNRLQHCFSRSNVALKPDLRENPWPEGVAPLLSLERLLLRRGKTSLSDAIETDLPSPTEGEPAEIAIDLVGDRAPVAGERVLRVQYDGENSDAHAVSALLAGQPPQISVIDVGTGAVLAAGLPSLEAADGLTGGLEAVYSRVIILVEQALLHPMVACEPQTQHTRAKPKPPALFALRNISFRCARAIYHLCCHSPHWRVGWRFVDGPDLLDSGELVGGGTWRIMQDRELSFAADPFPCEWRGNLGVFYERLDYRTNKGLIYYQAFDEEGLAGEPRLVLEEPWHLSYPFLMAHEGQLYMLPEASCSGAVTLYRCVRFPDKWEPVQQLLSGVEAADATIFRHGDRYWLMSVIRDGYGGYSDTLAIHHATDLFGEWRPHAQHPALVDSRYARPAGFVVNRNGVLLRPAQDCSTGYGKALYVMQVDELTPESFRQSPVRRIAPGAGWAGGRLHTLNRSGRLECIDGAVFTPKHLAARKLVHRAFDWRARHSGEAKLRQFQPAFP